MLSLMALTILVEAKYVPDIPDEDNEG